MEQPTFDTTEPSPGEALVRFHTSLTYPHAKHIWDDIGQLLKTSRPRRLILDLEEIDTVDSAGIALLRALQRHCRQNRIELDLRSFPPSAEYFLKYVESVPAAPKREQALSLPRLVSRLGEAALHFVKNWKASVRFFGEFILASLHSLHRLRSFRWRETLYYAQLSGSDAMPIIFLLSFLIGMVMAFQAAVQLRQFGANIFVADLLSLALTRELGPVFTAVILAGRSGAAFAAELGTMKVNEEIDALTVMGFDTTRFLVLPKVFALLICGPLLTLLANASGILGGIVVGILSLDLTAASFLEEVEGVLTFTDVGSGLLKSVVFAVLVGLIGCYRGLQANKGADSVGRQTTSAVVSGIFLIIFADAIFTILFHILGW